MPDDPPDDLPDDLSDDLPEALPDDRPSGTLTFVFTDIEGSTRLWEQRPDAMREALARHDAVLRQTLEAHGGHVFKTFGDAFHAAFADPRRALDAALAAQAALHAGAGTLPGGGDTLRVRLALHTGEAERRGGDYFGAALSRAARLLAAAHGGQALVSESSAALLEDALPEGAGLRSLGRHRLRDLAQTQEVFQLVHPALPDTFPPLRSLESLAHNLPAQLSRFIGRETELAEARARLAEVRLLSLVGPGGAGKTRLALQVAAESAADYPDGVWLVEFAPLSDPALVPQAVAGALGLREAGDRALRETLADALRAKSLLLIWDNCEHLIDACAHLAETLLRGCPGLRLLATSREALGIGGEAVLPLSSLSLPTHDAPTGGDAVRLFLDRAQAALPSFRPSADSAPAIAEICVRLDGLPLALELAAARVRTLTPAQIAARLDDRFRLLSGGARTALPRQQTLRALIDWSHALLSPAEQALLGRLSVFGGGWPLEAAEAVCAGGDVEEWEILDLLARLVAKSLVVAEPPADGQVRYRLLDSLRSYAAARLAETDESDSLAARHAAWFLALAEEAEPHLSGPAQASWLNRLERDHDNLRAALRRFAQTDSVASLRLSGSLWKFWWMRGYFTEGRGFLERALAAGAGADPALRARALSRAGILAEAQGDYAAAIARYEEGLHLHERLGDRLSVASLLTNLGNAASSQGEWSSARRYYEEGLAICRELGDQKRVAILLMNTGIVANHQKEYAEARALYEESLVILRRRQDFGPLSSVLLNLGDLAHIQKDYAQAYVYLSESLKVAEEIGEKNGIPAILITLGYNAWPQGQYEQAAKLFGAATALLGSIGLSLSSHDTAAFAENVAVVRAELGEDKFQAAWGQGEGTTPAQLITALS